MMAASPVERAASILGEIARRDVALGAITTYRVGGSAALLVEAQSEDDLASVHLAVTEADVPVLVVGNGSNLLVSDRGFGGVAVRLGEGFADIEVRGVSVRAGGAVNLPVLARRTAQEGLTGMEWAVGVPGSVGGAVRMNAGGHGSDVRATLRVVRMYDLADGCATEVDVDALDLSYRHSALGAHQVVVWADFALAPGDRATSEREISEIVRWRREHQPGGQNAGSVFSNPPGDSAGRLIDASGLKGLRIGSAEVSSKHANFFQADEGGSADDVYRLMCEVQRLVAERTGVRLSPEVRLVGFDEADP